MYSCLTFKLFDEKNSSLPLAEYESLRKRTDEEGNIISCFLQKVFASVSELLTIVCAYILQYSRIILLSFTVANVLFIQFYVNNIGTDDWANKSYFYGLVECWCRGELLSVYRRNVVKKICSLSPTANNNT